MGEITIGRTVGERLNNVGVGRYALVSTFQLGKKVNKRDC